MSDINQVGNNSNDCDSLNISALEFNPSASNVSEDIENLLVDESISESENENKYASDKKEISELFQNFYMHMDVEFQKYLENFNESVKNTERQKYALKIIFFICVMVVLFFIILFPYFLAFMFAQKLRMRL